MLAERSERELDLFWTWARLLEFLFPSLKNVEKIFILRLMADGNIKRMLQDQSIYLGVFKWTK